MINKKGFFDFYRSEFDEWFKQSQVNGLELLLGNIERDLGSELVNDINQAAYLLATVKHETANTFQPIKEYGRGLGRPYGKRDPDTGQIYYGRGYVQLTWKSNYATMGKILNLDLVHNPDLALDPEYAYLILVTGLDKGIFGADLDNYINNKIIDFILARKTVNGLDRAKLIAGYAEKFKRILTKVMEY